MRTWRCAPTPRGCWAPIPGWCCMAAATPPSRRMVKDMLGDDVEVICIKGSGWDMGAIEPAGLPAVRLAPLRTSARAGQIVRRGHGQFPAHQSAGFDRAQSVGRNAAARFPAAQIHRPHPFHRRAGADRPARRRGDGARSLWRPRRLCALHHSRLRLAKSVADVFDKNPEGGRPGAAPARHLHRGRDGASRLMAA